MSKHKKEVHMKGNAILQVFALSSVLIPLHALAQNSADAAIGLSGCGPVNVKFEVKPLKAENPAQAEPGKALVYFVEQDLNLNFVTHTSRIDIDGHPMGATYGRSYFFFPVEPGIHHLCATTQFGQSTEDGETAVAHFTAEAGGVYYFEMKNVSWVQSGEHDATLFPLDSDEGKFMTATFPLVSSRRKK
jgi:hypothetical protein